MPRASSTRLSRCFARCWRCHARDARQPAPKHARLRQQHRHATAGQGQVDEAQPLMCEALEVLRETLGNRHPKTLNSINNLGHLLKDKGDLAAAEPLCTVRRWR